MNSYTQDGLDSLPRLDDSLSHTHHQKNQIQYEKALEKISVSHGVLEDHELVHILSLIVMFLPKNSIDGSLYHRGDVALALS